MNNDVDVEETLLEMEGGLSARAVVIYHPKTRLPVPALEISASGGAMIGHIVNHDGKVEMLVNARLAPSMGTYIDQDHDPAIILTLSDDSLPLS